MNACFYRFLLLFAAFPLLAPAQELQDLSADYAPLKSYGTIPNDFTYSTRKKVLDEQAENKKVKDAEHSAEFTLQTNYAIDKQLHGGTILLNDAVSVYINKVADELLKNDPALRSRLHIYVTKVPETNAYSMDKGYIFINTGLIARAKNEAQMAFILSHEISHYVKKHHLRTYLEFKKIEQEKYKRNTFTDRDLKKFRFSKENELEADLEGYNLYKNSAYDPNAVKDVFDMLHYSYLPFEEIRFDTTFFNNATYEVPQKYFLKKTQKVNSREEKNDLYSTHPNIKKRKQQMDSLFAAKPPVPGKEFIVSEKLFYEVRDLCRFEECRLALTERDYMKAITSAYILQQKYPRNVYLRKVIVKSLYAMILYKNGEIKYNSSSYKSEPIPDFTKTEGYSQQLNFFLDQVPPRDMAVLALNYTWTNHRLFPEEKAFGSYSDSLMKMLGKNFRISSADFYRDSTGLNAAKATDDYYKYAFVNLLQHDTEFNAKLSAVDVSAAASQPGGFKVVETPKKNAPAKEKRKQEILAEIPAALKLNRIVVVDPFYQKYDETLPQTAMYMVSDSRESEFKGTLKSAAAKNQLELEIIDPGEFTGSDILKFNDYSVLQDWYNERMDGEEKNIIPVLNPEEINNLIARYNTNYFAWTGIQSIHFKNDTGHAFKYVVGTVYYVIVFDLSTGLIIHKEVNIVGKSDNHGLISKYVNNTMQTLTGK